MIRLGTPIIRNLNIGDNSIKDEILEAREESTSLKSEINRKLFKGGNNLLLSTSLLTVSSLTFVKAFDNFILLSLTIDTVTRLFL